MTKFTHPKEDCSDCPTGDASWVWACYQKGVVELPTISKALTAAADWLENEVLG